MSLGTVGSLRAGQGREVTPKSQPGRTHPAAVQSDGGAPQFSPRLLLVGFPKRFVAACEDGKNHQREPQEPEAGLELQGCAF